MNSISNLIYSCYIANSVYHTDPARKGSPSLVQVADIPGTSAPHFTTGTDTLLLSEILHYLNFSPSIISPLCAAESCRYFGRLSQVVTSAVTSLNAVTAMSAEHTSHTMPACNQRMLFPPHLCPPLSALRSGSLQRRDLSDLRTQQPLKEQSWCDEMDTSPAQGPGNFSFAVPWRQKGEVKHPQNKSSTGIQGVWPGSSQTI